MEPYIRTLGSGGMWVCCGRCSGKMTIADPNRKWWQVWKYIECPECNGTGMPSITMRPEPPPAPPPAR